MTSPSDRELMQMALDALRMCNAETMYASQKMAMFRLIERLSQPEPEPLGYWNVTDGWVELFEQDEEQKPFCWVNDMEQLANNLEVVNCGTVYRLPSEGRTPLYTAPPKREWVGLTDEEYEEILKEKTYWYEVAKAVEAKLKEKNT